MKICDTKFTQCCNDLTMLDAGTVVRLANGKVYLIGLSTPPPDYVPKFTRFPSSKLLINLETGLTHRLTSGRQEFTVLTNATLNTRVC